MKSRRLASFGAITALVAAAWAPMAGQARRGADGTAASSKPWTQTRTAWGDPDLQGTWRDLAPVPLERPEEFAGREFLTDAELAQKQKTAEDRQAVRLAGKVTSRAFRAQENYNIIFNTMPEKPRVNRRTSAIIDPPDGRLPPWTLEQVKLWEAREAATRGRGEGESWQDLNTGARCISDLNIPKVGAWGLGFGGASSIADGDAALGLITSGGNSRILQAPGYVTIIHEEQGEHLTVPVDQRPALKIRQWMGVPRGRWDGNTLVVEFTHVLYAGNYPVIPNASFAAYPGTGETLKVTQRFTRTGPDAMEYRYTVEDPAVYTRPYTVFHALDRDDAYKFSPDLCHENNRDMSGILANSRADEQQALDNGASSVTMRQPRFEKLKKEALEAASKQPQKSR